MTRQEAISKANEMSGTKEQHEALEFLVPEIRELREFYDRQQKDKRILREIKKYIKEQGNKPTGLPNGTVAVSDMIDWLEKQEEQKPVESISQLTVPGKGIYKICPRCGWRMIRDDSMVYTSMPPQYRYECPKCGEIEFGTVMYDNSEIKEQKPAEWSEEDEGELQNAIDALEFLGKKGVYKSESGYDAALQAASWLKSLPERFNLQPKQKWSEEDEQRIAEIEFAVMQMNTKRVDTKDKCLAWLKSLRPQLKKELSIEKAIQWLDDTFYFSDNSSGRGRDCEITTHDFDSLEEMYDSFRKAVTVDSEPHWKPSEEQMEALERASTNKYLSAKQFDILVSLYEHLKTLM